MSTTTPLSNERLELPEEVIELFEPVARLEVQGSKLSRESLFWLLATFLLFVTGLFKGINLLVLLAYLLAGIWLLNRFVLRSNLRRVQGRRIPAGVIFAGEPVDCAIELACSGKRAVRGVVVVDCGDIHSRKWLVLAISPAAPLRLRYRQIFPQRGRYGVFSLRAFSSFPFGLTTREAELCKPEERIVLPRLGRVKIDQMRQWLARVLRGDGRIRRRHLLPAPQEADIHGLRDFRPGDSPRWIHWRTSARRNQLLVREFEDSAQPHLVLIVEPWLPSNPANKERERLEMLISLAGTIVRDWCRDASTRLSFIMNGKRPLVLENGAGSEFAVHALELLAVEQGRPDAANTAWLQDAKRGTRAAPFLVLSSRSDSMLPGLLGGELARPVAYLDPNELPPWFERPQPIE
jgi:uncharacterized protein (DUF58 family)